MNLGNISKLAHLLLLGAQTRISENLPGLQTTKNLVASTDFQYAKKKKGSF
jgi:hypothetical protein